MIETAIIYIKRNKIKSLIIILIIALGFKIKCEKS